MTAVDVLVGLGWLQPSRLDEWRQGRVPYLEAVTTANLSKISKAIGIFRGWARETGLQPDPSLIELAVAASVRHLGTRYDELLMSGMSRSDARANVHPEVTRILDRWRHSPAT